MDFMVRGGSSPLGRTAKALHSGAFFMLGASPRFRPALDVLLPRDKYVDSVRPSDNTPDVLDSHRGSHVRVSFHRVAGRCAGVTKPADSARAGSRPKKVHARSTLGFSRRAATVSPEAAVTLRDDRDGDRDRHRDAVPAATALTSERWLWPNSARHPLGARAPRSA